MTSQCVVFSGDKYLTTRPITNKGFKTNEDRARVYKEVQRLDEWPGEDYDGTSVSGRSTSGSSRKDSSLSIDGPLTVKRSSTTFSEPAQSRWEPSGTKDCPTQIVEVTFPQHQIRLMIAATPGSLSGLIEKLETRMGAPAESRWLTPGDTGGARQRPRLYYL